MVVEVKEKCVHHWLCERGTNDEVPAMCCKCGAETIFRPKLRDGRSALDLGSSWADLRLKTLGGTRNLRPRYDGAWRGDLDNAVRVLEG